MDKLALALFLASGVATAAPTPQIAPHETGEEEEQAYIYFNIVTGEKVATVVSQGVRPAGTPEFESLWVADNRLPCAAFGQTGGFTGAMDEITDTTSAAVGATFLDWGDIPNDTVVDAVQVRWSTRHIDVDTDADGIGDGVPGLGCNWAWYDGDNGFNTCFTRTALTGFTLFNLPGKLTSGTSYAVYTSIVDLGAGFSSAITFEIGDSDSDPQGAAIHNAGFANGDLDSDTIPDGDLDGDGLADFAYTQRFIQPGTVDFDGDTIVDGDPAAAANAGNSLVAPTGPVTGALFDTIDPVAPLPAGQGIEDDFDIFTDLNGDGFFEPVGTFFYGGFTCDEDGDGTPGGNAANVRMFAQFWHILLAAPAPAACPADLFPAGAGDGVLNFFDVSAFLSAYNAQDPIADFFPVGAPDGQFNFFDVSTFLADYNAGCP